MKKRVLASLLSVVLMFNTIAPIVNAQELTDIPPTITENVDKENIIDNNNNSENSNSESIDIESNSSTNENSSTIESSKNEGTNVADSDISNNSSVSNDSTEPISSSNNVVTSTSSTSSDSIISENSENSNSETENLDDFIVLSVINPDNDTIPAEIGKEVTLSASLNRDDIDVSYQWQKLQQKVTHHNQDVKPIYDYPENYPTWYNYPFADKSEHQLLKENPDMKFPGIELYMAAVKAFENIGEDTTNISFEWKTPNYALEGYTITASNSNGNLEIYADKENNRFIAKRNSNGKFEFSSDSQSIEIPVENTWIDIENATQSTYTFQVTEQDYFAKYRLKVTVNDKDYLATCIKILEKQGVDISEKQDEDQILYSIVFNIENANPIIEEFVEEENISTYAVNGIPYLSDDGQWICNLNGRYEYITEDAFKKARQLYKENKISTSQFNMFWTYLQPKGFSGEWTANVLDDNGIPTGKTRTYNGFDLTDGHMLEVNSEWYGKTVYFRPNGTNNITKIKIPAYTQINGQAGTTYKKAITFLNPFILDTGSMYDIFLKGISKNGWLSEFDSNGDFTGKSTDNHIQLYTVSVEDFNKDPQRYMVDAEGNYRVDSVGWGVCTGDEPDLSGKAYWILKDYISNGYGFLTGHDTMYAYSGAYYDAFNVDLDEKDIDPNDTTTWYYNINTWLPTASDKNGNTSTTRGGHFYMNQLMGSNKGNVYSDTVSPSDAPSKILSTGGANGKYGKTASYGTNRVEIKQIGYNADLAKNNPRYRTPTNYPYSFSEGQIIPTLFTHTNGQAAFGPIWANYYGENQGQDEWGALPNPLYWTIEEVTGTNNFYLTGDGNFLMNQIGHLPYNSTTAYESMLFSNSVMYVSQRKQCEVCAANQNNQQTSHFVKRISAANCNEALKALQNGGSFWYPIDGCYQLTENITLPENWTPIKHFKGHWNSDVYKVQLNSKGTPLFANSVHDGASGWNLGADKSKGTMNVFDSNMVRTTGVARVLGDLNNLFMTNGVNYVGYTVKILGTDNPKYMSNTEQYSCTVNTDSKYVISNLPCIYDKQNRSGILTARVYDKTGKEVTEYGKIRVNVPTAFWNNCMTTPLYLGSFSSEPVADTVAYESTDAKFYAKVISSDKPTVQWQYRENPKSDWKLVPDSWGKVNTNYTTDSAGDIATSSVLELYDVNPKWNNYEFRLVANSKANGSWSTYDYYLKYGIASLNNDGTSSYKKVAKEGFNGKLTVKLWSARVAQSQNKTIPDGGSVTFTSQAFLIDADGNVNCRWQYATNEFDETTGKYKEVWHDLSDNQPLEKSSSIQTSVSLHNNSSDSKSGWQTIKNILSMVCQTLNINTFSNRVKFYQIDTSLTINKADVALDKTKFRVVYESESKFGTKYVAESHFANKLNWKWVGNSPTSEIDGFENANIYNEYEVRNNSNTLFVTPPALIVEMQEANKYTDSAQYIDPKDKLGQMLILPATQATNVDGTATYRAKILYLDGQKAPNISWEYRTFTNGEAQEWNQVAANNLGYGSAVVSIVNTPKAQETIDGQTYNVVESCMTIKNAPLAMYNTENNVKHFFRCIAKSSYETFNGVKDITQVDSRDGYQWAGLVMDYEIAIKHNGVLGYGGINGLDKPGGGYWGTVNSIPEIVDKTNSLANVTKMVTWLYPNITIEIPEGRHINTVIMYFDTDYANGSNRWIWRNWDEAKRLGIECNQDDSNVAIFTAINKDTVSKEAWESFLRGSTCFGTEAPIDYSNIASTGMVNGGDHVKWYIDENKLTGAHLDTQNGKAYKVVSESDIISWHDAKTEANRYNSDLGMNGYLAEITSAEENEKIRSMLNGRPAWIGAYKDDNGEWTWDNSNSTHFPYSNWENDGWHEQFATIEPNGYWSSYNASQVETVTRTMENIGFHGELRTFDNGGWTSKDVYLVSGHKYYISTAYGDKGDSNCGGEIVFDAFGIREHNNVDNSYNHWLTVVDGIYTFDGSTGTYPIKYIQRESGSDYSGLYAACGGANIYDLTAAFGAGNEPTNAQRIKDTVYGVGNGPGTWGDYYKGDKDFTHYIENVSRITDYVIEYDIGSLGMDITNHSAQDGDYIGITAKAPSPTIDKFISAIIVGNEKIYDGMPVSPKSFVVTGDEGANLSLFNIKFEPIAASHSGYVAKTVNGADWKKSGIVNAGLYRATVSLTDEAVRAGWKLSEKDSVLKCDIIVNKRPIDVFSNNNNKVYDKQSTGTIKNISVAPKLENRGVIDGDNVALNTTITKGYYTTNGNKKVVDNSITNSPTQEWIMKRDTASDLFIIHNNSSDPHHNYYLDKEDYTGKILQKGLNVHSIYLEDINNPRNVKVYDSTPKATVTDIVVDGIIKGDKVALVKDTLTGVYTKNDTPISNAGEKLTQDGKLQSNRMTKLTEYTIKVNEKAKLKNNDKNNYFIEKEVYSGAICRSLLEVIVKNHRYMYGSNGFGYPDFDLTYKANQTSNKWLNITGLKGSDKITLDSDFNLNALDKNGKPICFDETTFVGEYKVSANGLTYDKYQILNNYYMTFSGGRVEVYPRNIIITPNDIDRYFDDVDCPQTYSTFEMMNNDGKSYSIIGNDNTSNYSEIHLIGKDTIENTILANGQPLTESNKKSLNEYVTDEKTSVFENGSNISYGTTWYKKAHAVYLDTTTDSKTYPCDWCEKYHGFTLGTDHMRISGYRLYINKDETKGNILSVVEKENLLGQKVKNYNLKFADGILRVHPKLRVQLKATVPMYVCMYGYRGTGDVITPTNYGITNYSNCAIQINKFEVDGGNWNIVDKNPLDLLRGEMSFKLNDTQLVPGINKPQNPNRWVISQNEIDNSKGVKMNIPINCCIAGGNVNAAQTDSYITHITYHISEYKSR